jgi:hypothetical protein
MAQIHEAGQRKYSHKSDLSPEKDDEPNISISKRILI